MNVTCNRRRFLRLSVASGLALAAPYEAEDGYLFANDLNTPRRFETLAGRLLGPGHGEARVEKILGGNLLRVFREAWNGPT